MGGRSFRVPPGAPKTRQHPNGEFWTGWRMTEGQAVNVVTRGLSVGTNWWSQWTPPLIQYGVLLHRCHLVHRRSRSDQPRQHHGRSLRPSS